MFKYHINRYFRAREENEKTKEISKNEKKIRLKIFLNICFKKYPTIYIVSRREQRKKIKKFSIKK